MTEPPQFRAYEYGDMDPEYEDDALERAKTNLESLRRGEGLGQPLGRLVGRVVAAVIFLGGPGLALLYWAITLATGRRPVWAGAALAALFALLFLYWLWQVYAGSKAETPRRALTLFYRSLGAGKYKRALGLVLPVDQDAFPRYQPEVAGLGFPTDLPFHFSERGAFADYWNPLLRYHTAPYCLASLKKVRVRAITDDVVIVRFRLTLLMNTRLWLLLIFGALFIALIIDIATRKTAKDDLQKILIRVGDEWHLLNGAWQGPEEERTEWLEL